LKAAIRLRIRTAIRASAFSWKAGRGITIRGGNVRGFKVALLARRSPALHVTGFDGSYNWKPRLYSGVERESLADWLSHHDNEKDEWLRYGAAIYLAECDDAEIDNNRAVQGQNGLLVTRSARLRIWNNTFSWLSGLGNRPVSNRRQLDHAQPPRLGRPRFQPGLLQPRAGLRRRC
jgi:hypothetical protein